MGRRIRPLLFAAEHAKRDAELAARKEAIRIIDAWNKRLLSGTTPLFSPTIRAALLGGCRWLDVYCPGCKTVATVDLEKIDRHPDASLGSFVWWLKCRNGRGLPVPFPTPGRGLRRRRNSSARKSPFGATWKARR